MKTEYTFEILTDHFQLLFGDERKAPILDTTSLWDTSGSVVSLPGHSELIGLGTVRYGGTTRLTLSFQSCEQEGWPGWERMGDFEVSLPSGRLIFWGPEIDDIDAAQGIDVDPGIYHGIAFCRGIEKVQNEMDTTGPDE